MSTPKPLLRDRCTFPDCTCYMPGGPSQCRELGNLVATEQGDIEVRRTVRSDEREESDEGRRAP